MDVLRKDPDADVDVTTDATAMDAATMDVDVATMDADAATMDAWASTT